jgi:hypothetical protein
VGEEDATANHETRTERKLAALADALLSKPDQTPKPVRERSHFGHGGARVSDSGILHDHETDGSVALSGDVSACRWPDLSRPG